MAVILYFLRCDSMRLAINSSYVVAREMMFDIVRIRGAGSAEEFKINYIMQYYLRIMQLARRAEFKHFYSPFNFPAYLAFHFPPSEPS